MVQLAPVARPARRNARQGEGERDGSPARAGLAGRLAFSWLAIAASVAVANALLSILLAADALTEADRAGVRFNTLTAALGLAISVGVGIARPTWWRRAIVALAIGPVPILLVTSRNVAAGCATLILCFVASWLGRELVARFLGRVDRVTGWVIGATLGLALIALCGFAAGMLGILRPYVTWPLLLATALVLLGAARGRLRDDARAAAAWLARPTRAQPLQLVLVGAALGCLWLNLSGALAPEIRSDAVRQRLATAAQFARDGHLRPDDPELFVATTPALGEITFAIVLTLGPVQGAKLLHFLLGVLCAAAVFALGRRLGGPTAGGLAAFAFYGTLLTGYLSQTAYLDFFTTIFAVTATFLLVLRREPNWRVAVVAGLCIGWGVAAKVHFGYVAVGLGVTAGLLALRHRGIRGALASGAILTGAAVLAVFPWFARSYALSGQIPGLVFGTTALKAESKDQTTAIFDLVNFGFGQSLWDLLALPITTTLASKQFGGAQLDHGLLGGHIGYLALGTVPLLLVGRKHWRIGAMLAGAAAAALLWFETAQYLRYGLPIVAVLCAGGAAAYVGARRQSGTPRRRAALNFLVGLLALSGVAIRAQLPDTAHRHAFGSQTTGAYLDEQLSQQGAGSYALLRLIDGDPSVTRVLAMHDAARLYTRKRISTPLTTGYALALEADDARIRQLLREGGFSHILVDRRTWAGSLFGWDRMTALDEAFLRRNAVLVAGGEYSYLYRIVPEGEATPVPWATGPELLPNGDLELGEAERPTGWAMTGRPTHDRGGANGAGGRGALRLAPEESMATTVAVRPGVEYLLASATRGVEGYGFMQLRIEWRDDAGRVIGTGGEATPVTPRAYRIFSLLAVAPPGAATATISAQPLNGATWIDDLSFRAVTADTAYPDPARGRAGVR